MEWVRQWSNCFWTSSCHPFMFQSPPTSYHQGLPFGMINWSQELIKCALMFQKTMCVFCACSIYIYLYTCFTAIKLLSCQNHSESTRWSSKQVSKSIFARDIMYILYVANPKKIAVSHFSLFHFQFSHLLPMSIFGGIPKYLHWRLPNQPKSTSPSIDWPWCRPKASHEARCCTMVSVPPSIFVARNGGNAEWWYIYIYPLVI